MKARIGDNAAGRASRRGRDRPAATGAPGDPAGGSGTRLWPLSREQYPKQLLNHGGRGHAAGSHRAAPAGHRGTGGARGRRRVARHRGVRRRTPLHDRADAGACRHGCQHPGRALRAQYRARADHGGAACRRRGWRRGRCRAGGGPGRPRGGRHRGLPPRRRADRAACRLGCHRHTGRAPARCRDRLWLHPHRRA